jgi:hypothetical protein
MEWKRLLPGAVCLAIVAGTSFAPQPAAAQMGLQEMLSAYQQEIQNQAQSQNQYLQGLSQFEGALGQSLQAGLLNTINTLSQMLGSMSSITSEMGQSTSPTISAASCPVFAGDTTLLVEGSCVWAKATGRLENRFATGGSSALQGQAATFRIGGQKEVADGWFLGGMAGYGGGWWQAGNGASSRSQKGEGAVAVKRVTGPLLLMGALGFAATTMQTGRPDGVPGPGGVWLRSDSSAWQGNGHVRVAYDVPFADWYVRPRVDLALFYTNMAGYQEVGQSAVALQVSGRDKWSVAVTPAIEVGGRTNLSEGLILRPYLVLGASFMPDNNWTTVANFQGPLAALGSFQVSSRGPTVMANAEIGVQLYRVNGFEAKAEYLVSAGDSLLTQTASLRGAWHF